MTDKETLANTEATDAPKTENQDTARTYSQQEVDDMMGRMRHSLTKKLLKPYEDLGDPDELRQIREEHVRRQTDAQIRRGEFEKTLKELADRKDSEIRKRDMIIQEYKVNTPILSAAARYNAINAEQVRDLLIRNVRMNEQGDVEVLDTKGSVRYSDRGELMPVEDLVKEFLDTNPHFKTANPATTNTRSSITPGPNTRIDISKLDMNNVEHRRLYREYRKTAGLA